MGQSPPLYDGLEEMPVLERLTSTFYERVAVDPLLGPVFAHMSPEHASHVAHFLAEVLGGPSRYSEQHGGHASMIRHHVSRRLGEPQRRRWLELLLGAADEVGVPDDPEFRSAFVAYLEWGSRLAVSNSQEDAEVDDTAPMPRWGWGEVTGSCRR